MNYFIQKQGNFLTLYKKKYSENCILCIFYIFVKIEYHLLQNYTHLPPELSQTSVASQRTTPFLHLRSYPLATVANLEFNLISIVNEKSFYTLKSPIFHAETQSARSGVAPLGVFRFPRSLLVEKLSGLLTLWLPFGDKRWETKSNYITVFGSIPESFLDN